MRILVVGGGVAGPAVALSLKRAGHDVEVFDRVLDFLDVTAGVTLPENGMRVLRHLGLHDDAVLAGNRCDRYEMSKITGDPIAKFAVVNSGDLVTINILRTSLSRIIKNALVNEGVLLHSNKLLVGIEQPTDGSLGVKAKFKDGSVAFGDILIGADGVHSGVRSVLFSDRVPAKTGFVGYLGFTDYDPSFRWDSRGLHFFTDNVAGKSGMLMRASESQLHWVLYEIRQNEISHDDWQPLFDFHAERERIADLARKWCLPPVFQQLILGAREIIPLTIYDLETLPQWWKHNCVLIGGAKHAMLPFMGQACSTGLEDAEVLAALLHQLPADDPRVAFQLYQEARYARVKKIAEAARAQGKRLYAMSPIGAKIGHLVLKSIAMFAAARGSNLNSEEILAYDGLEAVQEILFRKGFSNGGGW
ncbi:hypothetical protein DFJ73DRAFT_912730 [Zopfochytrium polystomum]|nr:hypothetical protein DFJ73DRAFT_912730 [Zopfochytrium polystomum]